MGRKTIKESDEMSLLEARIIQYSKIGIALIGIVVFYIVFK